MVKAHRSLVELGTLGRLGYLSKLGRLGKSGSEFLYGKTSIENRLFGYFNYLRKPICRRFWDNFYRDFQCYLGATPDICIGGSRGGVPGAPP